MSNPYLQPNNPYLLPSVTAGVDVPSAPSGLAATGGVQKNTLTWNPVSDATSYNLYWSLTAGVTIITGTKITSITSPYDHTGLTDATEYFYVITAVNANGESVISNEVSATTTAAITYTAFDPAAKDASITLSGSNLIATSANTTTNKSVKGDQYKSGGKWYVEIIYNKSQGTGGAIGIAKVAASTATYIGNDTNGYAYLPGTGNKLTNNGSSGYGAAAVNGDVISMLFDATAGTLIFWKNGTTLGTAFTGITGSWALATTLSDSVGSANATLNSGASAFTYTPPAGYTGWGV